MKTLTSKIAAVLHDVGAVGKNSTNQVQHFVYRSIDEITSAIHPLLARHGLVIIPVVKNIERTEKQGKNSTMTFTVVEMEFHIRCAESDAEIVGSTYGESFDSGDKSVGKAMTYAYKKFLEQTFCLSPSEREDPDAFSKSDETDAFSKSEEKALQETDEFKELEIQIGLAKTVNKLEEIWYENKDWQTFEPFRMALTRRKEVLNNE